MRTLIIVRNTYKLEQNFIWLDVVDIVDCKWTIEGKIMNIFFKKLIW